MAEQPITIVADPISSDGSEDSWILLDEMDEAMSDIDDVVNEASVEASPATTQPEISIETAETYQPTRIEEVYDSEDINGIDFEPKIETGSSDLNETCPSDDNSDSEHMYRWRPYLYDLESLVATIDDGSSTDGSISMISETEFHRYETRPKRKSSKDEKDQLNMLMNCRPIDMTIKNPRPTVQIPGRCAMPASIEELAMGKPCIVDELIHFLERLNNFFATTYLGQVFLLFITIVSLTSYSIMYYRYTNIKLAYEDLDRKYFDLEVQTMDTDLKLAKCEYFYDRELINKNNNEPNVPKSIAVTEEEKKIISATNLDTNYYYYQTSDNNGLFEMKHEKIQPTKSSSQFKTTPTIDKTETLSTFDRNDNDDFEDDFVIPSIRDHHGRIKWVGQDESEYECDIDTEATTIKYKPTESGILCENDYNRYAAQKYDSDAHIHHTAMKQYKSMDNSKSRKEEKKIEKTNTKWEKAELKSNDMVNKYHLSQENFTEKKEKIRRDKKHRKDNDKENKNIKKDRKESKREKRQT